MKTPLLPLPRWIPVIAFAAFAAGCASPAVTATRRPFVGAEYEQVYVTGSHIPVLVPKSPTARRIPGISPLTILTPDEVRHHGLPMH